MNSFKHLLKFCLLSPDFFSKPEHFLLIKNTFSSDSGHLLDTNDVWGKAIELQIRSLDYNDQKRAAQLFKKLRYYKYGYLENNHNSWDDSLVALNQIINVKLFYYVPKPNKSNFNNTHIESLEYPECMEDDSWEIPHNVLIPRVKKEMRDIVKPLLQYSKRFVFIEPYFNPTEQRYINTLKSWLDVIKQNSLCQKISYYCQVHRDLELEEFKYEIEKSIIGELLQTLKGKIEFVSIGNKMHDRFILSDFAGFNFSYGLDEDKRKNISKEKVTKTSVTRLSQVVFNELRREYEPNSDSSKSLIVNYKYSP